MRSHQTSLIRTFFAVLVVGSAVLAGAQTETVIHAFQATDKYDGANAEGTLIADSKGDLYGTTFFGGKYNAGTVFKLVPSGTGTWTQNVVYSFTGGADGEWPLGPLYFNATQNKFYGTTTAGGTAGQGVVFELTPGKPWTETPIHTFSGTNDGSNPETGVIADQKGTLYGTAQAGGSSQNGIVFRLSAQADGTWKEAIITSFPGNGSTGQYPYAGLIRDAAGSLYGTTFNGGANGAGEVFQLTPPAGGTGAWTLNVLYSFTGNADGSFPIAGLVFDKTGALYGTTQYGGLNGAQCCGVVFQLTPPSGGTGPWTENVLYTFSGAADGSTPGGSLIFDATGALYGTAEFGGDTSIPACANTAPPNVNGCGVAFKLTPPKSGTGPWTERVLHAFNLGTDGGLPTAALLINAGTIYGTTDLGGTTRNVGTVFQIAH